MNERIKELIGYVDVNAKIRELAEQAGCKIDRLGYGEGNLEKFAELIVKECVRVGGQAFLHDNSVVPTFPSNQILEHFGVE